MQPRFWAVDSDLVAYSNSSDFLFYIDWETRTNNLYFNVYRFCFFGTTSILAPKVWSKKIPKLTPTPWDRTRDLMIARPTLYLTTTDPTCFVVQVTTCSLIFNLQCLLFNLGLCSRSIRIKKVLNLVLHIFPSLKAFESNTASDRLNHAVKNVLLANLQNPGGKNDYESALWIGTLIYCEKKKQQLWNCFKPITRRKKFRLFQIESVCRRQFQIWRKWQKVIQMGRKHCGKRRNCSFRAIPLFPTVFLKGLFPRGVKRCHCVGMG